MIQVIIPTYNRPECIKNILDYIVRYTGQLFKFWICDSSTNECSRNIIQDKIDKSNIKTLKYFRYSSDTSVDKKVIHIINQVDNEFFWVIGDGNIIDFEKLEVSLLENHYENYDVLNLEPLHRFKRFKEKRQRQLNHIYDYHNNVIEYAIKYFSRLTYWGAAIIKTDFFKVNYTLGIIQKYIQNNNPWWIACSIFEACAYDLTKKIDIRLGTAYSTSLFYNPAKKDHGWTGDIRYYEYVFTKFNQAIYLLPTYYDDIKDVLISSFRNDTLATYSYLLYLRSKGIVNLHYTKQYHKEINNIPGFYTRMVFYSLCPIGLAKIGQEMKKCLVSILRKD